MDDATIARTESAFREVNEAIAQTAERFESDETDFVCECADPGCTDRITADLESYEEVREEPTRFIVAPGHVEPSVELVVERRGEYDVIEKVGRTVARIARSLNPRARPA